MSSPAQLPAGIPAGITTAIQQNYLSFDLKQALSTFAQYRADARRDPLPPNIGETMTYSRLGMFDVDLLPAAPTGAVDLGEFTTEQFLARPVPYSKGFRLDGPTAYVFRGNLKNEGLGRLNEWAGRTTSRLARGKLFHYGGGTAIVRRAQSTSDTVLLVNSLAGFRHAPVSGTLQPVSATNPLSIVIHAASNITNTVVGVTPINAKFPDGPGEITLGSALSGNVAAQSYVVASNAPRIVRPNNRASTEAIVLADIPTLTEILNMRSRLQDLGVMPHEQGGYHLHVDPTFFPSITQDARWQRATQGMGPIAIFGVEGMFIPQLGITIFETNDSPALGKGKELYVGAAGVSGAGGTGTPGSSVSMQDLGLDVINSSGVGIRRAIMTGRDVMIETYIDEELYFSMFGIEKVGNVNSTLSVYQMQGMRFVSGNVDGWRLNIRPALDDRGISCTFSVSYPFDFTLSTDTITSSKASDQTPLKRAVVCEYGNLD